MSNTNTGGPAFPIPLLPGQGWQGMSPCDGMTLRDYFAAEAMAAILNAAYPITQEPDAQNRVAAAAYIQADAMLKARAA